MHVEEGLYRQILASVPIVCVDVAIWHDDRVLQVRRRDEPLAGIWWLPGGRLHRGELLRDAASRKADEEVSISIDPKAWSFAGIGEFCFDEYAAVGIVLAYEYPDGAPRPPVMPDGHHTGYRWMDDLPAGYLQRLMEAP